MTQKERKETLKSELNKLESQKAHAKRNRDELYKWLQEHDMSHPNWDENVRDWQYHSNKFNFLTDKIYKIKHRSKNQEVPTMSLPKGVNIY